MDRVYHDRRMLKWLPFDALPEQHGYLKAVYDAFDLMTKPALLPDQIEYLNYRIEEAFHTQESITLTVFDSGRLKTVQGTIIGVHKDAQLLMVGAEKVPFDDIIELT